MALKTTLALNQRQGLALSAQMRTALSVLRMSALELSEEIAQEVARNPFLLLAPQVAAGGANDAALQALAAPAAAWQENVRFQLSAMGLPAPTAALAHWLVAELREDGFLDSSLGALAADLGVEEALLVPALAALQRCDPPGVGARDLTESLCLQLTAAGLNAAEAARTLQQLPLFARADLTAIARVLGLSAREARARLTLIRSLRARPVAEEAPLQPPLRPDLIARRNPQGGVIVERATEALPPVMLDEAMIRRAAADGFAAPLVQRAQALIAAVEQRGRTLERIGTWLAQNQEAFFLRGLAGLAPVSRADLARALDLHPSTVGRAVAGKAVEVEGRLWPLSVVFSASIVTRDGVLSARQIQARITAMVEAEPPGAPLSDVALARRLDAEGVDIARRTVAKYREGLRIPSAAARRRLAAARHAPRDGG